tara:strand:- start:95 stop:1042 length:948 start_codon:yes stop_codon:yes gene_type:complete
MTQWYVKDLSNLTQISVQTLHHYDRIGLLVPSIRQPNGYRLYAEKDLLKLQQIIALKFFGFELAQIKMLLEGEVCLLDQLATQSQLLEQKANTLLEASHTLKDILSNCDHNKSIPWETIIQLIEVYRMTQKLENTWASKALSKDEFDDYVNFSNELPKRYTASEKKACEQEWVDIIADVQANLASDPGSEQGISIAERCLNWVVDLYGVNRAALRMAIWQKGFKEGQAGDEHGLSPEGVEWLDKAMYAYHRDKVIKILARVGVDPDEVVADIWNKMLSDMYGDNQSLKDEFVVAVLNVDQLRQEAKDWVVKISKK